MTLCVIPDSKHANRQLTLLPIAVHVIKTNRPERKRITCIQYRNKILEVKITTEIRGVTKIMKFFFFCEKLILYWRNYYGRHKHKFTNLCSGPYLY